jgi:hypothetical protein
MSSQEETEKGGGANLPAAAAQQGGDTQSYKQRQIRFVVRK